MKGIIFDLDGVIVSTDELHYTAWKRMADEEGIPFCRADNDRLRGVGRLQSLEIILEKSPRAYSDAQKQALATRKNDIYRTLLQSLTPADRLEGVTETLARLRTRGYKLAIGSSSKNTPIILEKIGYADYFDAVSDGNNITRSKPDPEVFLCAADYLGLPPGDCLVVEDAAAGIDAANAGGFVSVGVAGAAAYPPARHKLARFADLVALADSL